MDERQRRLERMAREQGDPLARAQSIREKIRSGILPQEKVELAAHVGDEAARFALGLSGDGLPAKDEDLEAWWKGFARFGREASARVLVALAREVLWSGTQGFEGVAEESFRVVDALDGWIRQPGAETEAALRTTIASAVEAPGAAYNLSFAINASQVTGDTSLEEILTGAAQAMRYMPLRTILIVLREEVVPWALGERDPVLRRRDDEGHTFGVLPDIARSIAFSPDGKTVLASCKGAVWTFDELTGEKRLEAPATRGEVFVARYTPDGKHVLASTQWGPARVLDAATLQVERTLDHEPDGVRTLCVWGNENAITAGESGHEVKIWNLVTGELVGVLPEHDQPVRALAASSVLGATGDREGKVRIFDLPSRTCLRTVTMPAAMDELAFAPDGKSLLVGCSNGNCRLLDPATGAEVRAFDEDWSGLYSLDFAPDGTRFVAVGGGGRRYAVHLRDVATARVVKKWQSFPAIPLVAAFSPTGRRVLVGLRTGGIRAYEL
jgi:hypothetical protein